VKDLGPQNMDSVKRSKVIYFELITLKKIILRVYKPQVEYLREYNKCVVL
jgi:hypothetical protein